MTMNDMKGRGDVDEKCVCGIKFGKREIPDKIPENSRL